jgi:hypothetical protein
MNYIDYIVTSRREVKNTMASPVTPLLSGGSTTNMLLATWMPLLGRIQKAPFYD